MEPQQQLLGSSANLTNCWDWVSREAPCCSSGGAECCFHKRTCKTPGCMSATARIYIPGTNQIMLHTPCSQGSKQVDPTRMSSLPALPDGLHIPLRRPDCVRCLPVRKVIFSLNVSKYTLTWSEIPEKPGSLQLSCREKGRRFRDTRLLGSTTTTSNLVEESPIIQIQDKSIKERFQERIQARTVREMQEREGLLPVSTPNIPASIPHTP